MFKINDRVVHNVNGPARVVTVGVNFVDIKCDNGVKMIAGLDEVIHDSAICIPQRKRGFWQQDSALFPGFWQQDSALFPGYVRIVRYRRGRVHEGMEIPPPAVRGKTFNNRRADA